MLKRYLLICLLFISFSTVAQNTINNYKYVIVPEKFSFLKEIDQYRLNTLTKMFLEEKGFTVFYDNGELPTEIANSKCNALNADVLEKNSMFSTNLTLIIKDCKGNILFKSKEGKSREKEFKTSYNLALRDAMTSLDEVKYVYEEKKAVAQQAAEIAPIVEQVQSKKTETITPSKVVVQNLPAEIKSEEGTLYAQPITNGYQLINTEPKIVLTLLKTSVADYFIASNEKGNGIVLKKNGDWYFEYYQNNQFFSEKISIKF